MASQAAKIDPRKSAMSAPGNPVGSGTVENVNYQIAALAYLRSRRTPAGSMDHTTSLNALAKPRAITATSLAISNASGRALPICCFTASLRKAIPDRLLPMSSCRSVAIRVRTRSSRYRLAQLLEGRTRRLGALVFGRPLHMIDHDDLSRRTTRSRRRSIASRESRESPSCSMSRSRSSTEAPSNRA